MDVVPPTTLDGLALIAKTGVGVTVGVVVGVVVSVGVGVGSSTATTFEVPILINEFAAKIRNS